MYYARVELFVLSGKAELLNEIFYRFVFRLQVYLILLESAIDEYYMWKNLITKFQFD